VAIAGAGWIWADKFRLMMYDRAAKTIKDLLPKLDFWVDEFSWFPSSQGVLITYEINGASVLESVTLNGVVNTYNLMIENSLRTHTTLNGRVAPAPE